MVFSAVMFPWKALSWCDSIELSLGQTQSIPQYTTSSIGGCQSAVGSKFVSVKMLATPGEYWYPWKVLLLPSPVKKGTACC